MSNFYSSLIINSKRYAGVHQVFKPRYNKQFFKRVTANLALLKTHIDKRCRYPDEALSSEHLRNVRDSAQQLVKLKEKLEKTTIEDDATYHEMLSQIESIEDNIMPTVIKIPNRWSKQVPEDRDCVIEELKSDFMSRQKLTKILSHRKLSYINNCYSKSVVGPNSHYYFGIGAKLQNSISDYFTSELEQQQFVPVSGPSLVKSAVVEAVNSSDSKEYFNDPARIVTETPKFTTLHLTEASRESLVGFVTTIGHLKSNEPMRLMTSGAGYRLGSDWFDGDDRQITQFETVHALVLNSSIEQYSMKEYHRVRDSIWLSYKKLELPLRLVHCSLESMLSNEYDAHRIDIWMPSRQNWLQVARISHYLDYITVRVGMRRGHLIDSSVFDGQVLTAAIVENRQTALGKFIIPRALTEHIIHMTEEEAKNYLEPNAITNSPNNTFNYTNIKATVMNNHEQRRYLRKMEHPFGHSRKASAGQSLIDANRNMRISIAFLMIIILMIDWTDFWLDYIPDMVRSVLYDYIYRPWLRFWWLFAYDEENRPKDLPYDEIDKTDYQLTMFERRKARAKAERPTPDAKDRRIPVADKGE